MNTPKIPLYADDIETAYDQVKEAYPLALAKRVNDYEIVFFNGEKEIALLYKEGRNAKIDWFRSQEEKQATKKKLHS